MAEQPDNPIAWIYSTKDNDELSQRYDDWAKTYDDDLRELEDYQAPALAMEIMARYVTKEASVLDVGAGTGLMGEVLKANGYDNIVAMDLSQGMLDVAAAKGVYTALHQMVLGEELEYATDSFDTAVATGVFTAAHAPASSFPELVRITKPGGHIIFTLSDQVYEGSGFKEMLDGLQAQGQWKLVEASESRKLTNDSPFTHRIWTFEVTA